MQQFRVEASIMAESRNLFAPVFREYPRGHNVAAEAHAWPQLLHASSGVIRVETEQASWIVAPRRAVWIPPGCVHESWMLTDVHFRSLYLTPSNVWRHMKCKVIDVSPLLGELILAAQEFDPNKDMGTRGNLITRLILEELRLAKSVGSPIPLPQDPRLLRLCRSVLADVASDKTLDELAREVGSCSKTIARQFDRELGMNFRKWREMVQIANATAYLAQGVPVKVAAAALGYTPSSFSVMLRRGMGSTPQVLQRALRQPPN
jgi:AraC-like DNA-binding protein